MFKPFAPMQVGTDITPERTEMVIDGYELNKINEIIHHMAYISDLTSDSKYILIAEAERQLSDYLFDLFNKGINCWYNEVDGFVYCRDNNGEPINLYNVLTLNTCLYFDKGKYDLIMEKKQALMDGYAEILSDSYDVYVVSDETLLKHYDLESFLSNKLYPKVTLFHNLRTGRLEISVDGLESHDFDASIKKVEGIPL